VAAAVVADGGRLVRRNLADVLHQVFNVHVGELGAFDGVVQVGDVGVVMLAVVDLHRLRVDMRLQRILRIRQIRQLESHG